MAFFIGVLFGLNCALVLLALLFWLGFMRCDKESAGKFLEGFALVLKHKKPPVAVESEPAKSEKSEPAKNEKNEKNEKTERGVLGFFQKEKPKSNGKTE